MAYKTNDTMKREGLISHDGKYLQFSDKLWEPVTSLYLVHISIRATSHPLNELKVMLRVSSLDLTTWARKDIHGSFSKTTLYYI